MNAVGPFFVAWKGHRHTISERVKKLSLTLHLRKFEWELLSVISRDNHASGRWMELCSAITPNKGSFDRFFEKIGACSSHKSLNQNILLE